MDLTEIPLPGRRAGLHLRPAAVHAARPVHPAGPGVPASRIRYEVFGPDLWAAQIPAEAEPVTT